MANTPPNSGALSPELRKRLEELNIPIKPWNPRDVLDVVHGHRTLGEFAGIDKQRQLEMATLGLQLLKDGLKDKATIVFRGLEALDPYDAYVQVCLGTIALEDEMWEIAEKRFNRALELNPASVPALYFRGEVRMQHLGKLKEGVEDLSQAVARDPLATQQVTLRARAILEAMKTARTTTGSGSQPAASPERDRTTGSQPAAAPERIRTTGAQPAAAPERARTTGAQSASSERARTTGSQPTAAPERIRTTGAQSASSERARTTGAQPASPERARTTGAQPAAPPERARTTGAQPARTSERPRTTGAQPARDKKTGEQD